MKVLAENRKAKFNYETLEKLEVGIVLSGHETKSAKSGKASIAGAHVLIRGNEAFLVGSIFQPYQAKNMPEGYDAERARKLLLTKKEIAYLGGKGEGKGLTIVPIMMYNKGAHVKLSLGLVRGKKKYDKRESIKKRDTEREIARDYKDR